MANWTMGTGGDYSDFATVESAYLLGTIQDGDTITQISDITQYTPVEITGAYSVINGADWSTYDAVETGNGVTFEVTGATYFEKIRFNRFHHDGSAIKAEATVSCINAGAYFKFCIFNNIGYALNITAGTLYKSWWLARTYNTTGATEVSCWNASVTDYATVKLNCNITDAGWYYMPTNSWASTQSTTAMNIPVGDCRITCEFCTLGTPAFTEYNTLISDVNADFSAGTLVAISGSNLKYTASGNINYNIGVNMSDHVKHSIVVEDTLTTVTATLDGGAPFSLGASHGISDPWYTFYGVHLRFKPEYLGVQYRVKVEKISTADVLQDCGKPADYGLNVIPDNSGSNASITLLGYNASTKGEWITPMPTPLIGSDLYNAVTEVTGTGVAVQRRRILLRG